MTRIISLLAVVVAVACGGDDSPPAPPASPPPVAAAPAKPPPAATPPTTERPRRVPTGEFEVVDVDLGTSIGPDGRIANPSTTLPRSDTIHAVVATEGRASNAVLTARWTVAQKQDTYSTRQILETQTQTISPDGPAVTAFHIVKAGGWPAGDYRIEISANGNIGMLKDFVVK